MLVCCAVLWCGVGGVGGVGGVVGGGVVGGVFRSACFTQGS